MDPMHAGLQVWAVDAFGGAVLERGGTEPWHAYFEPLSWNPVTRRTDGARSSPMTRARLWVRGVMADDTRVAAMHLFLTSQVGPDAGWRADRFAGTITRAQVDANQVAEAPWRAEQPATAAHDLAAMLAAETRRTVRPLWPIRGDHFDVERLADRITMQAPGDGLQLVFCDHLPSGPAGVNRLEGDGGDFYDRMFEELLARRVPPQAIWFSQVPHDEYRDAMRHACSRGGACVVTAGTPDALLRAAQPVGLTRQLSAAHANAPRTTRPRDARARRAPEAGRDR